MSSEFRVDFGKGGISRYHQLATLFRRKIRLGEWIVGRQIPPVAELAKEYGVATMTIRQAFDVLEKEGLIERFKAKGTFVRESSSPPLWHEVQTDWSGMLQAREHSKIELLSKSHGEMPKFPSELGRAAPAYLHLVRRHSRREEPYLLANLFIDERIAKKIPTAAFRSKTALSLVNDIEGVEITDARQIFTIEQANVEVSTQLQIPLNAPVARVLRIMLDKTGTAILVNDGLHRGDRVRLDIKLR